MTRTFYGPGGLTLLLDNATDAARHTVVALDGGTANYWAAVETAEVWHHEPNRKCHALTPEQCKWLWAHEDAVMKFLFE